jgi:hypothetical protein
MGAVTLPHGFPVEGVWHREAELRPIAEADIWTVRLPADAGVVTQFLARCLNRLGPHAPVTEQQVAALTVGDREALLLHLHRVSFGETMESSLNCSSCSARIELTLPVPDLLLPPYADVRPWREVMIDGVTMQVRAATGTDQAAVAVLADVDVEGAGEALVRRCLKAVPPGFELTPEAVELLSQVMQEMDPQADLLLNYACPSCGAAGQASLSTADFLLREVTARQEELLREIHYLAQHYHWSEAEILAVAPARRKLYLRLLGLAD